MLTPDVFDEPEFHRWKSRQITLIVKSVNDEVKSIDPDVKLVVNVYAGCATGESWCLPGFG